MGYTKMTVLAVAIVLLGIVSVAAFSPQPEASRPAAARSGAALETFYVPAQHVNQGLFEPPVEEFY